jgi:hypothetical protein
MSEPEIDLTGSQAVAGPKILYLDQNKWIDLARAVKNPDGYTEHYVVLEKLVEGAKAGRLIVPLTQTNIYETHKISDASRRHDLAFTQVTLSQGWVFRGRHKRLEVEATDVMRRAYGLEPRPHAPNWFLSNVFFEATVEWEDDRLGGIVSSRVFEAIQQDPPRFLYDYLTNTPEALRVAAVKRFSKDTEKLRQRVEARRTRDANEPLSMRRRIYSANLMVDDLELISGFISRAGLPTTNENDVLRKCARKLIAESPSYLIERELTLKLESQSRGIEENDFRDMQAFCAVIAYADIVVAENHFSNLAQQASLDKTFKTRVITRLAGLSAELESSTVG